MLSSIWPKSAADKDAKFTLNVMSARLTVGAFVLLIFVLGAWFITGPGPDIWSFVSRTTSQGVHALVSPLNKVIELVVVVFLAIFLPIAEFEIWLTKNGVAMDVVLALTVLVAVVRLRSIAVLVAIGNKDQTTTADAEAAIALFKASKSVKAVANGVLGTLIILGAFVFLAKYVAGMEIDRLETAMFWMLVAAYCMVPESEVLMKVFFPKGAMNEQLLVEIKEPARTWHFFRQFGVRHWTLWDYGLVGYPFILTYVICSRANCLSRLKTELGVDERVRAPSFWKLLELESESIM